MSSDNQIPVTALLRQWRAGNPEALAALKPIVYEDLPHLAARFLARESGAHTLQPTALLYEAYLKLAQQRDQNWSSRAPFLSSASLLSSCASSSSITPA